jgi:hypothetical protein
MNGTSPYGVKNDWCFCRAVQRKTAACEPGQHGLFRGLLQIACSHRSDKSDPSYLGDRAAGQVGNESLLSGLVAGSRVDGGHGWWEMWLP